MTNRRRVSTTSPVDFSALLIEKLRYTQTNLLRDNVENTPFHTTQKKPNGSVCKRKRVNRGKATKENKTIGFTLNDDMGSHGVSTRRNFSSLAPKFMSLVTPRNTGGVSHTQTACYSKPEICTVSEGTASSIHYSDPLDKMESHFLSRIAFPPSHKAIAVNAKIECLKVCGKKKNCFETKKFTPRLYNKKTYQTPRVLNNIEETYSTCGQVDYNRCSIFCSHCKKKCIGDKRCEKTWYHDACDSRSTLNHGSLVTKEKKQSLTTLCQQGAWHYKNLFLNQSGFKKTRPNVGDHNAYRTTNAIEKVDPNVLHASKENITKTRLAHSFHNLQKPKIFYRLPCQLKTLSTMLILFHYAWIWDPQNAVSTTPVQMLMKIAFLYLRMNSIHSKKTFAKESISTLSKKIPQKVIHKSRQQKNRGASTVKFGKVENNPKVTQLINKVFIRKFKRFFQVVTLTKSTRRKKKTFAMNPDCFFNDALHKSVRGTKELKYRGTMEKHLEPSKNDQPQEKKFVSPISRATFMNPQCTTEVNELKVLDRPTSRFFSLSSNKVVYEGAEHQEKGPKLSKLCRNSCFSKDLNPLSKPSVLRVDTALRTEIISTSKTKHAQKTVQVVLLPTVSTTEDTLTNTEFSTFVDKNSTSKLGGCLIEEGKARMVNNMTCLSTCGEGSQTFETPGKVVHGKDSCFAVPNIYVQLCPCLLWMCDNSASLGSEKNERFQKTACKDEGSVVDRLKKIHVLQNCQRHASCSNVALLSQGGSLQDTVKQEPSLNLRSLHSSTLTPFTSSPLPTKLRRSISPVIGQTACEQNALLSVKEPPLQTTGNMDDASVEIKEKNMSPHELRQTNTETSTSRSNGIREAVQDSLHETVRENKTNSTILEQKSKCLNQYSTQCEVAFEDLHQQSERLESIIQELDRLQNQENKESVHTVSRIQHLYEELVGCQWILDTTSKSREEAALKRFETLAFIHKTKSHSQSSL